MKKTLTELQKMVKSVFHQNEVKKKADREYKGERKDLYESMLNSGFRDKVVFVKTKLGGKMIDVEGIVESSSVTKIDLALLRELTTPEQFLSMIGTSKSKVEEVAGKAIAERCCVTSAGTTNVTVRKAK